MRFSAIPPISVQSSWPVSLARYIVLFEALQMSAVETIEDSSFNMILKVLFKNSETSVFSCA